MFEVSLQPNSSEAPRLLSPESSERPPHLNAASLMKERNCYFIHMMQVTDHLDVSQNNKSIDTKKLSTGDKLDILYAASPTLSVSTVRPNTQDGTFQGGFGVLFSQGEVISANPSDDGTIAKSLTEREIIGGARNTQEDIDRAIDRNHGEAAYKSYNELVLKDPSVAAGFMKLDGYVDKISYEEEIFDYDAGGGEETKKVGILDLNNEYGRGFGDKKGDLIRGYDRVFATLLEMKSRGPVYLMNERNEMLTVKKIDEISRKIEFSMTPVLPADIPDIYRENKLNKYAKREMLDKLTDKGIILN